MLLRFTILERVLHRLHLLPTPIMDAFAAPLFGRALVVAVRRGLFDVLASGPMAEERIAEVTKLDHRALDLLLHSCAVGGYLEQGKGGTYGLTAEGRKWLCTGSPSSLVNLMAYFELLHAHWLDLEFALEQGRPVRPYYEMYGEREWRVYVMGMRDLARLLLPHVIGKVLPDADARQLLDIGGSHGLYAIECCKRRPGLHATVMDFAMPLALAATFAAESGVADRVQCRAGNILSEPLPGGQDVVFMFNIIHGLTGEQNRSLVGRALEALIPGGRLFILDQMRTTKESSSAVSKFLPLMVGINLVNEVGGRTFSVEEVKGWCAGRKVKELKLRLPGVTLLEVAA